MYTATHNTKIHTQNCNNPLNPKYVIRETSPTTPPKKHRQPNLAATPVPSPIIYQQKHTTRHTTKHTNNWKPHSRPKYVIRATSKSSTPTPTKQPIFSDFIPSILFYPLFLCSIPKTFSTALTIFFAHLGNLL